MHLRIASGHLTTNDQANLSKGLNKNHSGLFNPFEYIFIFGGKLWNEFYASMTSQSRGEKRKFCITLIGK